MTSWHGNAFHITGRLWSEPPVVGRFPNECPITVLAIWSLNVLFTVSSNTLLKNDRVSGDLRRHNAYVTSLCWLAQGWKEMTFIVFWITLLQSPCNSTSNDGWFVMVRHMVSETFNAELSTWYGGRRFLERIIAFWYSANLVWDGVYCIFKWLYCNLHVIMLWMISGAFWQNTLRTRADVCLSVSWNFWYSVKLALENQVLAFIVNGFTAIYT